MTVAALGASCGDSEPTPTVPVTPNRPPITVGTVPPQTVAAGEMVTVNLVSYFSDPDGDALSYDAVSSNTAVATASVSRATVNITGVSAGAVVITVTASDPAGSATQQQISVTVERANQAPAAVGTVPARTMTAGETATVDVAPFFNDPDGDALTYVAVTSNAAVASVSVAGSTLTVVAVAEGSATVTVTARDPGGLEATQSAGVTVERANQAPAAVGTVPARTMTVGETATVDVAPFFNDPDGDALTYVAVTSNAAVASVSVAGSTLTVVAVAEGSATVTVTARDPGGLEATQSAGVTVARANQAPVAVGAIPARTMRAGERANIDVALFFNDPDGDALTHTALTSNAAVAGVSLSGTIMTVVGVAEGSATVTVTARDPGGLEATQSANVTVERANQAPVAVGSIPPQTVRINFVTILEDIPSYFSDPDGDTLSITYISSNPTVVTPDPFYDDLWIRGHVDGTATITVTARDPGGLEAFQTISVTVGDGGTMNRAPVAVNTIPGSTLDVGATEELDVSSYFGDADGDPLTYTATSANANVATAAMSGNILRISGVASGATTVTVTARDPDGLEGEQRVRVAVVGSGDVTHRRGARITTLPSRIWTPERTSSDRVRVIVSGGETLILFPHGHYFELAGIRYTCVSGSAECRIDGRTVIRGTILAANVGGGSNRAPEAVGTIPWRSLAPGATRELDVSPYFRDPDGDSLAYEAATSNVSVATVAMSAHTLRVAGVATGTATITVTAVDPNGLMASQAIAVTIGRSPDLVVESPSVSNATPAAGDTVTLSVTVRNRGDAQSGGTTLRYYRSSNETITQDDAEVGTDAVGALPSGDTSEASIDLRVPLVAGTYHYGACVDPLAEESDGDNNCTGPATITIDAGGQSPPRNNADYSVTYPGNNNRLTWRPVSGATFYNIHFCWDSFPAGKCRFVGSYRQIARAVTDTTYLHLNPGRPPPFLTRFYFYIVQACNVAGCASLTARTGSAIPIRQDAGAPPDHLRQPNRKWLAPPSSGLPGRQPSQLAETERNLSFGRERNSRAAPAGRDGPA